MSTETAAAPAAPAAAAAEDASLIDSILSENRDVFLKAARVQNDDEARRADGQFAAFLKQVVKPGQAVSKDVEETIRHWIAQIDKKLGDQLDEILHQPEFQKLEATWRGLDYLVRNSETSATLKIKVLNASKDVLFDDLERASQFDQSALFKKVYEAEYGQLGGQPYGLLVGDFDFGRGAQDVGLLKMISGVAAAAHAPFVANAGPGLFGFDSFTELNNPRDLGMIFDTDDYAGWRSFREMADSRYIALAMPRVSGRYPYGKDFKQVRGLNYEERVDGRDHSKYLWMNASWAYALRCTTAFAKHGWFAMTRGVEAGGKVENLPVHTFRTDDGDVTMKCPTEVLIPDRRENELSTLGFLPLLHCKGSDFAAFIGAQSCQKPQKYFDPAANSNAELSAKFNLMLNTSRFAHYLKVMCRNWLGRFMERSDLEVKLNDWIQNYVTPDPSMVSDDEKAKRPLQDAKVAVTSVAGKPGYYNAVAYLRPHFQLEAVNASLRLVAEVSKKG